MNEHDTERVELANELVLTLPSFGRWVSSIWNSETPFGRVSHRQVTVLYMLRKPHLMLGQAATASSFAELLAVRRSVITRVLASLESGGLITRASDPDDRRSQQVVLTEQGHALSVFIEEIFLNEMATSIDFLSDDDVALLLRAVPLLNRISSNLEHARTQRLGTSGDHPFQDAGL